ncbi:MAG: hypothetical protein A2451_16315, partial [Bdellovibrionales bacterium RIFOXYC2_FULL_39_8]
MGNKCPPCPACPPKWIVTFSDMTTLLLTFFILLLSFAKTETSKSEAVMGSVQDAFGGNVLRQGEVMERGKSMDDAPTMIEGKEPVKPFPIEFLTSEGLLEKREINRASEEDMKLMKRDLSDMALSEHADLYEMPESIKVRIREAIYFKKGTLEVEDISIEVFEKLLKLLAQKQWIVFIEGHASVGESSPDGKLDAIALSSLRAAEVSRKLIQKGVPPNKISTVFYGDSRPLKGEGIS